VFHSSFWDGEEQHWRCRDRSCFAETGEIRGQGICSACVRNGEDNKVITAMDERRAVVEKSSLWTRRGRFMGPVELAEELCDFGFGFESAESRRRMIPGFRPHSVIGFSCSVRDDIMGVCTHGEYLEN